MDDLFDILIESGGELLIFLKIWFMYINVFINYYLMNVFVYLLFNHIFTVFAYKNK